MSETKRVHIHRTKDGSKIPVTEMGDGHLLNTIALMRRKAKEGLLVRDGGGSCPEDFWLDEWEVFGREALDEMGFDHYVTEAKRRGLEVNQDDYPMEGVR